MISFNRTASIVPGKTAAALGFAREIATYMKNTYDVDLEVMLPIGGNPQRVAWSARYKDLAAFDAVAARLLPDAKYWEIVGKASDCFIAGATRDSIWRTL